MLLRCCVCGQEFERCDAEYKRNQKIGRKVFCSRSCTGKLLVKNIPKESKRWDHLPKGSTSDEYSPFRWHLKNIRRRNKVFTISLQDLKEQWEKQKGICPYTGWVLKNMSSSKEQLPKTPDRASLDRIDSKKGYVKGNIQFVSLIAQFAKNSWDESVLYDFAEAIKKPGE